MKVHFGDKTLWLVSTAFVKIADYPERNEIINYSMIIMPLKLASTLPWDKWNFFIYPLVSSSHFVSDFRKFSRCPLSPAPFVSSIRKVSSGRHFTSFCATKTCCVFVTDSGVWHLGNSRDNCHLKLLQRDIIWAFNGAFPKIPTIGWKTDFSPADRSTS